MAHDTTPKADKRNMRLVSSSEPITPATVLYGTSGRPASRIMNRIALARLHEFRDFYHAVQDTPTDALESATPSTWEELFDTSYDVICTDAVMQSSEVEKLASAGVAGCGVMTAFLEVYPRVLAHTEDTFSEDALYQVGRASNTTLLSFARHSVDFDKNLTYALVEKEFHRTRLSKEAMNRRLRFRPEYFVYDPDADNVQVDYTQGKSFRGENGRKLDFSPSRNNVVLGCPFFRNITKLHYAMLGAALRGGLLMQSYEDELR